MSYLKILESLSGIELVFVALIFLCGLLYLHFFLNYLWNQKQLKLLDEAEDYHLIGFGFWGMMVCVFTLSPFFIDKLDQVFTVNVILLLLSVVAAKYYYFKSLRKLLKLPAFDIYYKKLIYLFVGVSCFLFIRSFELGAETLFDISKPTSSNSALRNIIIPFQLKSFVKMIFMPNFLFCFVAYLYLIYKSYKKNEYLITFGVAFTLVAIIYTNSYHLFQFKYWMPLNVIADVFELLRLNFVQKQNIHKALDRHRRDRVNLKEVEESYRELDLKHSTFKHDLANNLFKTELNLQKANILMNKDEPKTDEIKKSLKKALDAQKMANEFFSEKHSITEFCLDEFGEKLAGIYEIDIDIHAEKNLKIKFNSIDFNNIFTNLIKNAKEANLSQSDPWIKIWVEKCPDAKMYSFKVVDSGHYDKIKNKNDIFKDGVSSKSTVGRGLGLYSVKKLIEKHNGSISLESFESNTCFRFNLEMPS